MIKKNMLYKLKMSIRSWIIFEQFRRVVKFNRKAWLNSYIDKKTEPRKNVKNDFEKNFSELINKVVFRKTMENVRKNRDIKLVTTETRRNYLILEPNYHTTFFFFWKFISQGNVKKKTEMFLNKQVYLGLSLLETSKQNK